MIADATCKTMPAVGPGEQPMLTLSARASRSSDKPRFTLDGSRDLPVFDGLADIGPNFPQRHDVGDGDAQSRVLKHASDGWFGVPSQTATSR